MINVISVLGGEKKLGFKPGKRSDFDALIKMGMPLGVLFYIKKELNLPDEMIARIAGVRVRTISRRKKPNSAAASEKLSPVESDRVYRFGRIVALAENTFEDKEEALEWLKSPQFGLGGRIPFDMLQTDAGTREVEGLLTRIDYGVIS
jgi:putative toxin-antitoxin system antitoxin component (TIGR02293 family)